VDENRIIDLDDYSLHKTKINFHGSTFDIFKKINDTYDDAFILESLTGPRELSEFSIIGFDPLYHLKFDRHHFKLWKRGHLIYETKTRDPIKQIRAIMPKPMPYRDRFIGGAVGYVSYDAIRFWENIPRKKSTLNFPLLDFGIYTDGIIHNRSRNEIYYFHIGNESRINEIIKVIYRKDSPKRKILYTIPKSNIQKRDFISKVVKAKGYLHDGEIFQVVLSRKLEFEITGDLLAIYLQLRKLNPSPYMYFMKRKTTCIIGCSPEMLVRSSFDNIQTFPIAGTRKVTRSKKQNMKLGRELLKDEKEVAEHTMLVDLARNDIGKVCVYGSVKTKELMHLKAFSHVQHIVSQVIGKLEKKYDCYDAFRAVFPAGTVTGAPKIRAMTIINELEPESRGPYAGALGYFSFNGSSDFAIIIRSIFVDGKQAYVQSGAGIVLDSVPEIEWLETVHKASALMSALEKASPRRSRDRD
jgi:anthranilate synthase component 1